MPVPPHEPLNPSQSCPGPAVLEAVASSGSDDAVLLSHISSCDACREAVEDIRENNRFLGEFSDELSPAESIFEDPAPARDLLTGYRMLGEIHRGAQGIVYRAEQERTRRPVAVKMLLQGAFATSRQRARFEREAEIAAQLRHPNIVTVYDSMPVKGGRFALVMEFIDGKPLDEWVSSHSGISPRSRIIRVLELFAPICDAVHYAHQRGVIHRDLKPANILVDSDGQPRVLDFGIAKLHGPSGDGPPLIAAASGRGAATAVTQPGEFAGTLAYASPEQLSGQPELIDTRTDVYALGVILYELLTGRMPYQVNGPFAEVIDHVLHEPPAPLRRVLPAADKDLETLVERCLTKEPERRYQSAAALLADIRHYLAGDAIDARRDSQWYVLRKWAARRKPLAIAIGSLAALLVVGASMGAYATAQRNARHRVEAANAQVSQSRLAAELSSQNERHHREAAETAKAFLSHLLSSVRPGAARGREVSMQYMLDRTEEEIAAKNLASNPTVEIEVRMLVGTTYIELGLQQNAIPHLRRALELCRAESAEPTLVAAAAEEALGRSLGLADEESTRESVELLKSSLATRRRLAGEGSLEVASSLNTLGLVYVHHGGFDSALSPLREAVAIRRNHLKPDDPDLLESMGTLAQAMWQCNLQDTAGAEALFKECVAARAALKEPDHPIVADALYQMAHMYNGLGDSARALPIANDALAMYRRVFGEHGVAVAHCLDLIAGIHAIDGRVRDAEPLLIRAAEIYRKSYGPDSEQRLITLANLGRIYCKMGRYEKAETTLLDWYHGLERTRGAGDQDLDMARSLMRQLYQAWDKPDEAARWGAMSP